MGQYIRHATVTIEEVLPHIKFFWGSRKKALLGNGHEVGVTSLRLKTFYRALDGEGSIHCIACDMKASFFAVESFTGSKIQSNHVNLYGIDKNGNEVLFTHDHIVPKSCGGKNDLENTQVMCRPCNTKKGSRNDSEFKAEMRGEKYVDD